MDIEGT
jgi:hypothetical protein